MELTSEKSCRSAGNNQVDEQVGRPRAHIIGENRATADVVALHVDHQEMVPFPAWRKRGPSASQEVGTYSQAKSANRTLIRDTKV